MFEGVNYGNFSRESSGFKEDYWGWYCYQGADFVMARLLSGLPDAGGGI
jgi:hypothetical protein